MNNIDNHQQLAASTALNASRPTAPASKPDETTWQAFLAGELDEPATERVFAWINSNPEAYQQWLQAQPVAAQHWWQAWLRPPVMIGSGVSVAAAVMLAVALLLSPADDHLQGAWQVAERVPLEQLQAQQANVLGMVPGTAGEHAIAYQLGVQLGLQQLRGHSGKTSTSAWQELGRSNTALRALLLSQQSISSELLDALRSQYQQLQKQFQTDTHATTAQGDEARALRFIEQTLQQLPILNRPLATSRRPRHQLQQQLQAFELSLRPAG